MVFCEAHVKNYLQQRISLEFKGGYWLSLFEEKIEVQNRKSFSIFLLLGYFLQDFNVYSFWVDFVAIIILAALSLDC